jgi:alpha-1,6-mannosyltransferase
MHICDLTTLYIDGGEGGVNTYLTEKARYFSEHHTSNRHTIIVPGKDHTRSSLFGTTVYTVKSPRFPYNPHHRIMTNFRRLAQLLRATEPDLIEVDCEYLLGHWAQAAMGKRRVPLVGFYHTHLPSFYARPLTRRFGAGVSRTMESCAWAYVAYCMQPLDKILVASSDIYERVIQRTPKKVEQIPLGVNLRLFRPRLAGREPAEQRRLVILYVGRLSQEKDLRVLFEAFQLLNRRGAYRLQIVGDGPLRAKTERFVRSTPHAVYAGPVHYGERLAELYASADVLALPSRNETFGLVVLEALASGLPVVAVDQGGPANLLCPRVGALAVPGDPEDFADKVASILTGQTSALQCRAYVERHFSWEKTFARLLDIYEGLHQEVRMVVSG